MIELNPHSEEEPQGFIGWFDADSYWVACTKTDGWVRYWAAIYPDGTKTGETRPAERTYPVPLTQWEKEIYNGE